MRMPQSWAMRARRGAFRLAWSQPMRIFSVTGTRHRTDRRVQDRRGGGLVAHQRRAGLLAERHLLHRAAEVDVDQVGAAVHREPRRLGHRRRLAAGELQRARCRRSHPSRPSPASSGSPGSSPRRRSSRTPPCRRQAAWPARRNGRSVTPDIGARMTGVSIRTPLPRSIGWQFAGRDCGVAMTLAHHLGKLQSRLPTCNAQPVHTVTAGSVESILK